ncbi:MAG: PaaI family thioesterase [Spirochaetales bacterium]|nr:PaaI family thioesterase [Spirochaetales bacterium]
MGDMKHRIKAKQNNSKNCLVCGTENTLSLQTKFYETENDEVIALFTPEHQHQSYPGITHGGISSAILDETIGRAIMARYDEQVWGVTVELKMRYRKPVPYGIELKAIGRITEERGPFFEGTGEIILPDGEVAVSCTGKYMKRKIDQIANDSFTDEEWYPVADDEPVGEVELP